MMFKTYGGIVNNYLKQLMPDTQLNIFLDFQRFSEGMKLYAICVFYFCSFHDVWLLCIQTSVLDHKVLVELDFVLFC